MPLPRAFASAETLRKIEEEKIPESEILSYTFHGDVVMKGRGPRWTEPNPGELRNARLRQRLSDISGRLVEIGEPKSQKEIAKQKRLELDSVLLQVQLEEVDDKEFARYLLERNETEEKTIIDAYYKINQVPGYAEWFCLEYDIAIEDGVSAVDVAEANRMAFNGIVRATHSNAERVELHRAAFAAEKAAELQLRVYEIAGTLGELVVEQIEASIPVFAGPHDVTPFAEYAAATA